MIPGRILAALGVRAEIVERIEGGWRVRVDDVDRRYRDAIKAGAKGDQPPREKAGGRVARLRIDGGEVGIVITSDEATKRRSDEGEGTHR